VRSQNAFEASDEPRIEILDGRKHGPLLSFSPIPEFFAGRPVS